jgi:hypothetical protein
LTDSRPFCIEYLLLSLLTREATEPYITYNLHLPKEKHFERNNRESTKQGFKPFGILRIAAAAL